MARRIRMGVRLSHHWAPRDEISPPWRLTALNPANSSCRRKTSGDHAVARYVTNSRLTFLSNVVAYACRPSSTKDRHDVQRHRRLNSRGAIDRCRWYDAHGLPAGPGPANDRRKGRKGRKPRILRKYGPRRRCRTAAESGGTPFWGPYSGTKIFSGARIGPPHRDAGDWHIACGNCGNPHGESHWGLASALPERGRRACPERSRKVGGG
jgi:hypothetical protein